MSSNRTNRLEQGQEGASFAHALRDCMVCGMAFIDEREELAALSGEAAQILGFDPASSIGAALELLPEGVVRIVRETLGSGEPAGERSVEIPVAGGGKRRVSVEAMPVPLGKGRRGVVLGLKDVSTGKKLERNLWQLDRLATMGTLAASMAHEIKNALVAGKTFVDLLLEKQQGSELTEVVRREMGRIDTIVSRILNFARPAGGAFTAVHLHEVLEHSLSLVQPQLQGKSIALERSFRAEPDVVKGHDYELQQAFVNLLLNALEAMGPEGKLVVATDLAASERKSSFKQSRPPMLRVAITDTGVGIPAENMPHLFEPFFTTKPSGTGLGLPITQRLIQEHRGSISVRSKPDEGTTFEIVLPAAV